RTRGAMTAARASRPGSGVGAAGALPGETPTKEATRMPQPPTGSRLGGADLHLLLAYVADLELEVDHLRRQGQFVQHQARETLKRILLLCQGSAERGKVLSPLAEIDEAARQLAVVLQDVQEPPGYHPAHDQVVAIAVRPLAEQVFRWQQRLLGGSPVTLRLE